jgi:hypothetical protein
LGIVLLINSLPRERHNDPNEGGITIINRHLPPPEPQRALESAVLVIAPLFADFGMNLSVVVMLDILPIA